MRTTNREEVYVATSVAPDDDLQYGVGCISLFATVCRRGGNTMHRLKVCLRRRKRSLRGNTY